jgi:hypothetical protein
MNFRKIYDQFLLVFKYYHFQFKHWCIVTHKLNHFFFKKIVIPTTYKAHMI